MPVSRSINTGQWRSSLLIPTRLFDVISAIRAISASATIEAACLWFFVGPYARLDENDLSMSVTYRYGRPSVRPHTPIHHAPLRPSACTPLFMLGCQSSKLIYGLKHPPSRYDERTCPAGLLFGAVAVPSCPNALHPSADAPATSRAADPPGCVSDHSALLLLQSIPFSSMWWLLELRAGGGGWTRLSRYSLGGQERGSGLSGVRSRVHLPPAAVFLGMLFGRF
ncbi:hypothetical protein R3P38DRAFT_3222017 [Favolaschia claudopus]|uniref:Uncharacterized protein n=1 Tax=Favolaschia claudopus TaxID=2862362 RepID=A0AAV9ZYR9_9AGAR